MEIRHPDPHRLASFAARLSTDISELSTDISELTLDNGVTYSVAHIGMYVVQSLTFIARWACISTGKESARVKD